MYLESIYSEPEGLFPKVIFVNGVNFIFGKKDLQHPSGSVNSIGKSTFLDLIDFCLLSSYNKTSNPRLFAAKEIMLGYDIVLRFAINNKRFIIKRGVETPQYVYFGEANKDLEFKGIDEVKMFLCNEIFYRPEYEGHFSSKWFRPLITFYTKIHKIKRDLFNDPIKYTKDNSESELNIYHFYLLGLPNKLIYDNFNALKDLKKINPAISEIKTLLAERYDLKNDQKTQESINKLRVDIKSLENAVTNFSLSTQYSSSEDKANEITGKIKDILLANFGDKQKIDLYTESSNSSDNISTIRIRNIYEQLIEGFGIEVKQKLDDAIKFRQSINKYRLAFLEKEINTLNANIKKRELEIQNLELERAKILRFLSAKEAIRDLTEAYSIVNDKRNQLFEIESRIALLNELNEEKGQIKLKRQEISTLLMKFINASSKLFAQFYEAFTSIYNSIYPEYIGQSNISINYTPKKDQLVTIAISTPDMYGKGKNIGRSLIYDLFVLLNGIKTSSRFPHFLIHDGIFDGVDKSHFLATYEFIQKTVKSTNEKVQYIVTINEEGMLNKEKFGESDILNPEKIEQEAILVLTPNNKLFGQDFTYDAS